MADLFRLKYPSMSLPDAIDRAKLIYAKEHMSAMTPTVAAEAMGYKGISGTSLSAIADLKKYGLLEGRGDQVRLSKDAQVVSIDDPTSSDYVNAINRMALKSEMFSELHKQFLGVGSERNIAVYLEKAGFKPSHAAAIARNYKVNLGLMGGKSLGQHEPAIEAEDMAGSHRQPVAALVMGRGTLPGTFSVDVPATPSRPEAVGTAAAPFRITQNGTNLHIVADVDLKGLQKLKRLLDGYELMLKALEMDTTDIPEVREPSDE